MQLTGASIFSYTALIQHKISDMKSHKTTQNIAANNKRKSSDARQKKKETLALK